MVTTAIKKGYKQTELGIIPEDWSVSKLGDLGKCLIGLTYKPSNVTSDGVLVLRSSNVQNGKLSFLDNVYVNADIPNEIVVKNGDILICARNGSRDLIGKSALINNNARGMTFGAFMSVLRPNKNSEFIFHQFQSNLVKRQINEHLGATINQITNKSLSSFKIAVPPQDLEQSAIATVLSDADALIDHLDKLITKKKDAKQGTMQQLLTGKKRLPGFSGEWEKKDLRQILQTPVTDGPHLTPKFLQNGVPFLSVNNLNRNKIDFSDLRYISKQDHEEFSKKCKPQKNDILLGKAASVGLVALVDTDLEFNIWSPIALIRLDKYHDPKFIYYSFQTKVTIDQIKLLTNSSSQGNIGMGDIEKISFLMPHKDEQTAIATILSDMDTEIEKLEQKRDKYAMLKNGMMQQLLTGNIRIYATK